MRAIGERLLSVAEGRDQDDIGVHGIDLRGTCHPAAEHFAALHGRIAVNHSHHPAAHFEADLVNQFAGFGSSVNDYSHSPQGPETPGQAAAELSLGVLVEAHRFDAVAAHQFRAAVFSLLGEVVGRPAAAGTFFVKQALFRHHADVVIDHRGYQARLVRQPALADRRVALDLDH